MWWWCVVECIGGVGWGVGVVVVEVGWVGGRVEWVVGGGQLWVNMFFLQDWNSPNKQRGSDSSVEMIPPPLQTQHPLPRFHTGVILALRECGRLVETP